MIFFVVGSLILLYAFLDYKKSFLAYLIFKSFLNGNITVLAVKGYPTLTLDLMMLMFYIILFFLRKNKIKCTKMPFDFAMPFLFLVFSWIITSIFSVAGFENVFSKTVSNIINETIIVYMIWEIVDNEDDFKFLFKWFTIVFFISCIYGLIEHLLQTNPLMQYEQTIIQDVERVRNFSYDASLERGYRISSIFEHSMGAGINWSMYIIWVLVAIIQYKWKVKPKYIALLTVILCVPCIILSKSRSILLFFIISCFSFVNLKNRKFYFIAICILVFSAFFFIAGDGMIYVSSIFDKGAQDVVKGSSMEMRLSQLEACIMLLKQHIFIGWGYEGFANSIVGTSLAYQLRGMESIWFTTMTYYGIIGLAAEVFLAYISIIKIPRKYRSKSLFFFSLAYWLTYSITTFPGILTYMYYLVMFFIIKQSDVYKKQNDLSKKVRLRIKYRIPVSVSER